jgi:poly(3-hydroxybutyrate) depolymerase
MPKPQFVPKPYGACPEFVGPEITLNPEQGPRVVKLWIGDAAQTLDGPLVFNWHGWHGSPGPGGIDAASREALLAMGGMLVAPYIEASDADKYWDMDDVLLADEVVGCAIEKVGVDLRRIYSTGLSAGGRQSLLLAYQRSGYIAAIVTYSPGTSSGSLIAQDPDNPFAAMISHGGSTEDAIFQQLAEQYFDGLVKAGHFVIMCQHTSGHSAPSALRAVAFDFLQAHPFGTQPSPYAGSLPPSYPSYCGFTK